MKKTILPIYFFFISIIHPILGAQLKLENPSSGDTSSIVKSPSQYSEEFNEEHFWDVVKKNFLKRDMSDIQDKDLVLLLGDTGAGKSTTTNFLLGHEMEEREVESIEQICVKEPRNKELPFAVIGYNIGRSETALPCIYTCKSEGISYMDCPGFWDTKGIAQEAFNSMMVRFFVKRCKSAKCIAVVITESGLGERKGQLLIEQLLYLNRTFNILQENFENVLWLVTKCRKEKTTSEHLEKRIRGIWKARVESNNSKKAKKQEDQVAINLLASILLRKENILPVHPLDGGDSRIKILKRIKEIKKSIPKERFKITVTQPIDIQGVIRNAFLTQEALKSYRQSVLLLAEIIKNKADKKELELIVSNPSKDNNSLLLCAKVLEERIKKAEKEEDTIKKEIVTIKKRENEVVEYKKMSKKLGAYFFGDKVNIVYDDHPFVYKREKYTGIELEKKKIIFDQKNGKYNFNFSIPANKTNIGAVIGTGILGGAACAASAVVGAGIGALAAAETLLASEAAFFAGAGGAFGTATYGMLEVDDIMKSTFKDEAEIVVTFYIQRKYIDAEELTYQKSVLKNIQDQLKEDRNEKTNLERGVETASLTKSNRDKGISTVTDSINNLQKRINEDKDKLECYNKKIQLDKHRLEFIYYMYRLLYDNEESIDPMLKSFEEEYRIKEGKKEQQLKPSCSQEEKKEEEEEKKNDEGYTPPGQ